MPYVLRAYRAFVTIGTWLSYLQMAYNGLEVMMALYEKGLNGLDDDDISHIQDFVIGIALNVVLGFVTRWIGGYFASSAEKLALRKALRNKAVGDEFRDKVAKVFRFLGAGVGIEVYKKTPMGRRFIDIELSIAGRGERPADAVSGAVYPGLGLECKAGIFSRYGGLQKIKDDWLKTRGYVVVPIFQRWLTW